MEEISTKIDIAYAGSKVRFSLRSGSDKKLCITKLDTDGMKILRERIKRIEEDYTWKRLGALEREKGLTKEKPGSESHELVHEKREECENVLPGEDRYYFHLRVKNHSKRYGQFRLFGYQKGDLFCITHFDLLGKIHHS